MSDSITLRVWTQYGKEHIFHATHFRTHCGCIDVSVPDYDVLLDVVKAGEPCNVSFLSCESHSQVGHYTESKYYGCRVVKDKIYYSGVCLPDA